MSPFVRLGLPVVETFLNPVSEVIVYVIWLLHRLKTGLVAEVVEDPETQLKSSEIAWALEKAAVKSNAADNNNFFIVV